MKHFFARILALAIGLVLFALGIVLTIKANIGYAPWDVFHVGLAKATGLSIGMMSVIVGVIVGIIAIILGEKLGLGTICNMVLVGFFIDTIFPHVPLAKNVIVGLLMLIAGFLLISMGTFFYIKTAFGAGPRDSLMVALARRTKFPIGLCRSVIELSATIAGWFLGGMVGIGTVISVFAIGFCIQLTFKIFKFDVKAIKHETLRDSYATLKSAMRRSSPSA